MRHHAPEEVFSDDAVLAKGVKDLKPKYGDQEIRKAIRDVRDFLKPALAA